MPTALPSSNNRRDLVVLGELLIDFTEDGCSAAGQRLFEQNAGGAVANVVCAVARLGLSCGFIGKVGDDMHGRFLEQTLRETGVDTAGLLLAPDVFTTLAFVALSGGERSFSFARKPGADTCLRWDEVDAAQMQNTRVFHIGSLSMTDEPVRHTTLRAIEAAKQGGAWISYDPNFRASLWRSRDEAIQWMRAPLSRVDVMKLSDEETVLLTDLESPEDAAKALCASGIPLVAVTLGKRGALVCVKGQCREVAGYDVPATDTTGAGDAFWGGFLYSLLQSGKSPGEVTLDEVAAFARFGNATATCCVTRRGGIPAMPALSEVEELMGRLG